MKCLERWKMCQISISLSAQEKVQIKISNTENSSATCVCSSANTKKSWVKHYEKSAVFCSYIPQLQYFIYHYIAQNVLRWRWCVAHVELHSRIKSVKLGLNKRPMIWKYYTAKNRILTIFPSNHKCDNLVEPFFVSFQEFHEKIYTTFMFVC